MRANLVVKADCEQNTEEVMENLPLGETSAIEKEQLRRDLIAGAATVESLEAELITEQKLLEDKKSDADYDRACKLERINVLVEREEQTVYDVSSSESKSEDHDIKSDGGNVTEHESSDCITGSELDESRRNSYSESVERAEENFTNVGTSFRLPSAAATCENYEATNSEEGVACCSLVAAVASSKDGSTGGQSVKCPICLCEFGTQEVGSPESCNHSFCADCLQEWSENANTCPVGQEVYDAILVRAHLGGEIVRRIHVEPRRHQIEDEEYMQRCEVCGHIGFDDGIIFCVGCGHGYHLECVYPPLDTSPPPLKEWFCSNCSLPSPLCRV
jgi:hypothetical protein